MPGAAGPCPLSPRCSPAHFPIGQLPSLLWAGPAVSSGKASFASNRPGTSPSCNPEDVAPASFPVCGQTWCHFCARVCPSPRQAVDCLFRGLSVGLTRARPAQRSRDPPRGDTYVEKWQLLGRPGLSPRASVGLRARPRDALSPWGRGTFGT